MSGEELRGEREIRENELEWFDNPHIGSRFVVSILAPELFTRCPKTGYPDLGQVGVTYIPGERCVELKSWKLSINRFASEKHFHEDLTGSIFKSLCELLDPLWIRVCVDFNPRGNVSTRVAFERSRLPQGEIPWQLIRDTPPVRL